MKDNPKRQGLTVLFELAERTIAGARSDTETGKVGRGRRLKDFESP